MIVDSSALVAVLLDEPEAADFVALMLSAQHRRMSAVNWLESITVYEGRLGQAAGEVLDRIVEEMQIELVPVTVEQVLAARLAWRRFGKGNDPAHLNLGDCFAYALAQTSGEPLLFKGDDFARTDIQRVL